jgi:hypothetical protein
MKRRACLLVKRLPATAARPETPGAFPVRRVAESGEECFLTARLIAAQ